MAAYTFSGVLAVISRCWFQPIKLPKIFWSVCPKDYHSTYHTSAGERSTVTWLGLLDFGGKGLLERWGDLVTLNLFLTAVCDSHTLITFWECCIMYLLSYLGWCFMWDMVASTSGSHHPHYHCQHHDHSLLFVIAITF